MGGCGGGAKVFCRCGALAALLAERDYHISSSELYDYLSYFERLTDGAVFCCNGVAQAKLNHAIYGPNYSNGIHPLQSLLRGDKHLQYKIIHARDSRARRFKRPISTQRF